MLAILTTHPIQYQVPVWRALKQDGRVPFEVWYLTDRHTRASHDREFGKTFAWDLDTLEGYPHRFLEAAPGATPGDFWKCRLAENLGARLRKAGANVLWIQGWQVAAYWQAAFAARGAGADLWLRAESNDLKAVSAWKQLAKKVLLGQFFQRVDHYLCIGKANRRLYEAYGARPEQLHAAPYAVDNERFARQAAALAPSRASIREQWGIPEGAFCVLFCGKFIPKKHPSALIAAARLLRETNRVPAIHLLFAGSGELGDQLRQACTVVFDAEAGGLQPAPPKTLPWRPSATFAGFLNQTEISRAYVAADCLVLPSDAGETWGLVVNEAMASGLPCAASRACGCTEDLLSLEWPERAFDPGDTMGLANAIVQLFRGNRSGDAERQRIASYSIQGTLDQVAGLYLKKCNLVNAKVRPRS